MAKENSVFLIGNVATDPEFHTFSSGDEIAEFQLAVDKSWKNDSGEWENYTSFFTVKSKYNDCTYVKSNVSKGDQIYIRGKLKQERWDDGNSSKVVINTRTVENIGGDHYDEGDDDPQDVLDDVDTGGTDDDIPF